MRLPPMPISVDFVRQDLQGLSPKGGGVLICRRRQVHWTTVTNGGFLPAGPPSPAFCHAGKNGFDDRPFVEYLLELK